VSSDEYMRVKLERIQAMGKPEVISYGEAE
jgi:hypothetical protein